MCAQGWVYQAAAEGLDDVAELGAPPEEPQHLPPLQVSSNISPSSRISLSLSLGEPPEEPRHLPPLQVSSNISPSSRISISHSLGEPPEEPRHLPPLQVS